MHNYHEQLEIIKKIKLRDGDRKTLDCPFCGGHKKFTIEKHHSKLEDLTLAPLSIDIIYYDAFAPECQPYLWQEDIMRTVLSWLKPGGYLLTYCAKGSFRRICKSLGCRLESLPGPPGKREISRFVKENKESESKSRR